MSGLRIAASLFRAPQIGPFLIGRTMAATASWMERLALGWLMWEATGSAAMVGGLAFVRLAPSLVLGPWGGVLADRRGSVLVLAACYAASVPLAVAAMMLAMFGILGPEVLLALGAASGALQSIANGPMKSAVSDVTPRAHLATAVPVASVTFNLAAFVGPAIAGGLIAAIGAAPVFLLAAIGFLAFVLVLMRLPRAARVPSPRQGTVLAFSEAGRHALRHPVIGPLFLLHVSFSVLMRPIVEVLPAVSGQLFGGGASTMGLLTASSGLGAFAGSLWLTWRSDRPGLRLRVLGAALAACCAALAVGASEHAPQAAIAFAALGGALVVRAAGANTIIQLLVEDHFRGRVMAMWGTILRIGAGLGGLFLGILADSVGMRPAILLAAVFALLSTMVLARRIRDQ